MARVMKVAVRAFGEPLAIDEVPVPDVVASVRGAG